MTRIKNLIFAILDDLPILGQQRRKRKWRKLWPKRAGWFPK